MQGSRTPGEQCLFYHAFQRAAFARSIKYLVFENLLTVITGKVRIFFGVFLQ